MSIPRDFTFRTSRTQRLSLQASDDAFGASNKDAPVIIARPDGAVLFRGAVRKGVALDVEVSVPTAVDKLDVTMGKQRSSVPLNAGGR